MNWRKFYNGNEVEIHKLEELLKKEIKSNLLSNKSGYWKHSLVCIIRFSRNHDSMKKSWFVFKWILWSVEAEIKREHVKKESEKWDKLLNSVTPWTLLTMPGTPVKQTADLTYLYGNGKYYEGD